MYTHSVSLFITLTHRSRRSHSWTHEQLRWLCHGSTHQYLEQKNKRAPGKHWHRTTVSAGIEPVEAYELRHARCWSLHGRAVSRACSWLRRPNGRADAVFDIYSITGLNDRTGRAEAGQYSENKRDITHVFWTWGLLSDCIARCKSWWSEKSDNGWYLMIVNHNCQLKACGPPSSYGNSKSCTVALTNNTQRPDMHNMAA